MKMVLKWMRGQNHVKLVCNHLGDRRSPTEKEFLYTYVETRSERLARGETSTPEDEFGDPSAADSSSSGNVAPHSEGQTAQQTEPTRAGSEKVGLQQLL
jgi:hypothetical protein